MNPRWQRGPHARLDSLKLGVRVLTMAGEEGTIAGSMVRHVVTLDRQAETGECVVLMHHTSPEAYGVYAGVAEVVVLAGAP